MNGILMIASVTTADSGTYICTASDGIYSFFDRAEIRITVMNKGIFYINK